MTKTFFAPLKQAAHTLSRLTKNGRTLCDAKSWYKRDYCLDYSDELIQSIYIMRYYPAYLAEYYFVIKQMFLNQIMPETINALSIGCGAGVDYQALDLATSEHNRSFTYAGIDTVSWSFVTPDVSQYFRRMDCSDIPVKLLENASLIIFPKSLVELSDREFHEFRYKLAQTRFTQSRIILWSSSPNDVSERFALLKTDFALRNYQPRYRLDLSGVEPVSFYKLLRRISRRYWSYPDEYQEILQSLHSICPDHENCPNNCSQLDRNPVTTFNPSRMINDIVVFDRRGDHQ